MLPQARESGEIGRRGHERPEKASDLLPAPANLNVKADHPVLIARAHHGDVAVDVVLALNDLLGALRNVGAICERNVVGELLLDRDLGASGDRVVSVVNP